MASKYLKKIASAHPDAVQTAIQMNPLSTQTVRELKELSDAIAKAPKVSVGEKRTPANDFIRCIIPKLENMMQQQRTNPEGIRLPNIELVLPDVSQYSLEQLVTHHQALILQDESLQTRVLLVRYQRGLVYQRAHQIITDFDSLKEWLSENFTVSYTTITAYMSVASLIKAYPMIMKCGLHFEQLRRHNSRLYEYFKSHPGFDEQCDILDGDQAVTIEANPYVVRVCDSASKDPDFETATTADERCDDFPFFDELTVEHHYDQGDE